MILFGCMHNIFNGKKKSGMENRNDELQALCPKRLAIHSLNRENVECEKWWWFGGSVVVEITT